MALTIKDRVKEATTVTGTGAIPLGGSPAGFQAFSTIGNGNSTYYSIYSSSLNEWEVGVGTYAATTNSISRDTVLSSSNNGLPVNFSAGIKEVICTLPASVFVSTQTSFSTELATATAGQTVFVLTSLVYNPGANSLAVYVNGLCMVGGVDYIETAFNTVTFTSGLALADQVLFIGGRTVNDAIGAEAVSYIPAGTGAVATSVRNKLRESVSVKDFGATGSGDAADVAAFQAASEAANGAVITVPFVNNDTALPTTYADTAYEYTAQTPLRTTHTSTIKGTAKKAIKTQFPTPHTTATWSAYNIEAVSQGSGKNGPSYADYGQTINLYKKGYAGVADPVAGEIDGLSIFIRQDGPKGQPAGGELTSDCAGILVNIQNVEDCGFLTVMEAASSTVDRASASIIRSIQTQIGVLNTNQVGTPSYGYVTISTTGNNDHAFHASQSGTGTWVNILYAPESVVIDSFGNYRAINASWPSGVWSINRSSALNGSTQFNHRGSGALFFNTADTGSAIQFGTENVIRWQIDQSGNFKPISNKAYNVGASSVRVSQVWASEVNLGNTSSDGVRILSGTGSPEAVVTANVGSLYLRTDGGVSTTLYVKTSGISNTGWTAK